MPPAIIVSDGVVDGDTLGLSTFDGGHAYSFVSKIQDTGRMQGFYYSGATSVETWVAEKMPVPGYRRIQCYRIKRFIHSPSPLYISDLTETCFPE
jgi:hypothetical protein